jgi:Ca2+-binding RTX toxin-like protein
MLLQTTSLASNKIFNVRADNLEGAVFRGSTGIDTINLIGGGTFDLTSATLSSIETVRGTSKQDTIFINSSILGRIKTLAGGGGGDVLNLVGNTPFNFTGKTISGFSRIEATSKIFNATFSNKSAAMLVWADKSQNDSLTLVGGTFTEEERAQLHRQGVDTIIDSSGSYTNYAPRIHNLYRDKVYTSGGQAFLDRDGDAIVGGIDDKIKSLAISFEDLDMRPGQIIIVEDAQITLPDQMAEGGRVLFNGTLIGTLDPSGDGGLTINFNAGATGSAVEALIHRLAFKNTDPDPSIRIVSSILVLTDEGGRSVVVPSEIIAGGPNTHFFDHGLDDLIGTDGNDTFATDSLSLNNGDAIDGGDGSDTLFLIQSGLVDSFDLTQLAGFGGIEVIKASTNSRDSITISGSQLTDVRTIDGGEILDGTLTETSNFLNITGTEIALTDKDIVNFSAINLRTDGAVVTLNNKTIANLINASLITGARIDLIGNQVFSAAEKGALFRHGIETVSDASGTYTNQAPELDSIDGDQVSGTAGHAIFIDAGRNMTLIEDDQGFQRLTVSVENGAATERLGIATTGKVQLVPVGGALRIYVNGINIGLLTSAGAEGPLLTIQFTDKATPNLVQELIRALTYTDTTGKLTTPREIKLTLTDYTFHTSEAVVTLEQELNEKPSDISLDGSFIAEASSAGTLVGVLGTADENEDDTFTYTLLGDAGGRFAIQGNLLVVKQGVKLDFEQAASHEIKVRVTDKLGLSVEKTFTIEVGDVFNEVVIGSSSRDIAIGDEGSDRLYGKLGNDLLTGGMGRDVFDTKLGSANIDGIRDFSVRDDTIWLSKSIFTKIAAKGALARDAFWIGTKAHDASDRIIYDSKKGALLYDPDGTGSAHAIKFAQLSAGLKMTSADFVVI